MAKNNSWIKRSFKYLFPKRLNRNEKKCIIEKFRKFPVCASVTITGKLSNHYHKPVTFKCRYFNSKIWGKKNR